MSTSPESGKKEQHSTYFVQDRANREERTRVMIQDKMLTASMGGVLPEQTRPEDFRRVLDIGCGTGNWLLELATAYPAIVQLVGVDISGEMIRFARQQTEEQHLSERVQFQEMDALRMLEFPDNTFDLVNVRFAISYLRTWDWPKFLTECSRVLQSGGILRLTEPDMVESNSAALMKREELLRHAFFKAGHFFEPTNNAVSSSLARLLKQYGFEQIQTRSYVLEFHSDSVEGQNFSENMQHGFRTLLPFMRKWGRVPENYEEIYHKAVQEMQQADFVAHWPLMTAWGTKA